MIQKMKWLRLSLVFVHLVDLLSLILLLDELPAFSLKR